MADFVGSQKLADYKQKERRYADQGDGSFSEVVTNKRPGVKVAHAEVTTATTGEIVAAVAGKKIRVLGYTLVVNEATATTVNFARATTNRVTGSPSFVLGAAAEKVISVNAPDGGWLFETPAGERLGLTSSGATDLSVAVVYQEI